MVGSARLLTRRDQAGMVSEMLSERKPAQVAAIGLHGVDLPVAINA